jgi:hypothetical protein
VLKDSVDERGSSFPAPGECFADGFPVRDAHLSTLLPGRVRGNDFHVARNEILLVMSLTGGHCTGTAEWELPVDVREFDGSGAVVIRVSPARVACHPQ